MGSVGDPYDNACAESCISTIKMELVRRQSFRTRDQARLAIFDYIEAFYNPLRRHSTLGYISPDAYERQYRSTKHESQKTDDAGGDVSRRQQSGKGLPLTRSGLTEPAEASRPALQKGAPAGLETPYHHEAVA
jgi:hypothetical protein